MVLAFLALILHTGSSAGTALPPREMAAAPAPRLRVLVRIDLRGAGKSFRLPDVVDQVREIWRPYIDIDFADVGTGIALTAGRMRGYDDELTLLIIDRLQVQDDLPAQERSGSSNEAALGWTRFRGRPARRAQSRSLWQQRGSLMSRGRWLGRRIDDLPLPLQRKFVTHALSRMHTRSAITCSGRAPMRRTA